MFHTCCSPAVTLVSHAWHDVFYSEPALWGAFRLGRFATPPLSNVPAWRHTEWLAAKLGLLRRVAPLVTAVEIHELDRLQAAAASSSLPGWVEELLSLPYPDALRQLELTSWSAVGPAAGLPPALLARFSNMRSLTLQRCGSIDASMLAAVCSLRKLTALAMAGSLPPQLFPDVAEQLPQLQSLVIHNYQPMPHAARLTRLTGLQHLVLRERLDRGFCLQPPAPAQLPRLQTYAMTSRTPACQVSWAELPLFSAVKVGNKWRLSMHRLPRSHRAALSLQRLHASQRHLQLRCLHSCPRPCSTLERRLVMPPVKHSCNQTALAAAACSWRESGS